MEHRSKTTRVLTAIQLLVAVSAFGGGIALVAAPDGSNLQFDKELLDGSPFNDFLVPGLILMLAVGGSSLIAAFMVWTGQDRAVEVNFAAGAIVFGWITIEAIIIGEVSFLHWLYWTLGAVTMVMALASWRGEHLGRPHAL